MSHNCIRLEEEIEGDREGTSDFAFFRIGSSVPLKRGDSSFDLSKPPGRPLAVSEKFGVLFLVSDGGFIVVKTVDVIGIAKRIKEIEEDNRKKDEAENLCVQEKRILDAQIGDVHILAVSTDSSILAVTVGRAIHFFSVSSLVQKKQETCFVCSVGESGNIKDFLWRKNGETSFIVLSSYGLLYHGNMKDDLKDIMDGVEAVDWSVDGNFLAVARKNILSILSSEYREKLSMSLLFHSWTGSTDLKVTVKVDSIKWVRCDSIVIGCFQVNEDDEEIDYMIQVITTTEPGFGEASSNAVVFSFSDLFHGIVDDIVPSGSGPHLFVKYLKNWNLALVANRKNTDEHVVLLAWSGDDGKGPVGLEFEQEKFIPRIELQENRDENLLLGFDIDRVSIHEKVELIIDSEVKVISPHCVLLCLSCEGKLIMFHVARVSEPGSSPETLKAPAEDDFSSVVPLSAESISSTIGFKDERGVPTDAKLKEISSNVPTINIGQESRTFGSVYSSIVLEQASTSPTKDEKTEQISQFSAESSLKYGINSTGMKSGTNVSLLGSQTSEASTNMELSAVFSKNKEGGPTSIIPDNLPIATFGLQSIRKPGVSDGIMSKSSLLNSYGSTLGDSQGIVGSQRKTISQGFSSTIQPSVKLPQESGGFTSSFDSTKAPLRSGYIEPVPAFGTPSASSKENFTHGKFVISSTLDAGGGHRVYRFPGMQESETKLIKQFYSVDDMTKELDDLLADIEQEGGLRDACTVIQRSSVLSLEEGINKLSEKLRMCKVKVEEQLKEIQQLQDKRMQVSARQIYMEGLVKQASNGQYWDLWNCQKLGPEYEVKQQRISKLNHALVNELVELERHFNALELRKHGESSTSINGRRALRDTLGSPRQKFSLHSLYNTLNSQISVAEQLSDCLSKQMGLLKISSPPAKQHSVRKELLESIGLEYDSDSFQSPTQKKAVYSPESSKRISFLPLSSRAGEHARTTVGALKTEPESSRRRRDSLDRSWSRFDPPKTTVKRMQLEERFKVATEKLRSSVKEESGLQVSAGAFSPHQGQITPDPSLLLSMNRFQSRVDNNKKDDQTKSSWQLSEPPSSSHFKWTKDLSQVSQTGGTRYPTASDVQTGLQSTPVATPSSLSKGLVDKFGKEMPQTTKQPVSPKVEIESQTRAKVSAEIAMPAPTSIPSQTASPIKASQSSETWIAKSSENGAVSSRPSPKIMDRSVIPDSSFRLLEKSRLSLSSNMSGNVPQEKTVGTPSGTPFSGTISTSSSVASPVPSPAPLQAPLVSVSTSASASPAVFGGSSSATASYVDPSQASSSSISSVAIVEPLGSSSNLSSPPQISKTTGPASVPPSDVTSQLPQAQLVTSQTVSALGFRPAEVLSKPQPTVPQSPISEVSTAIIADRISMLTPAATPPLSEIPSTSSSSTTVPAKGKDAAEITTTEDDEMEEEAPDALLSLGAFGGFALGRTAEPSAAKPNPFGVSLNTSTATPTAPAFSLTAPAGELFRPASFSLPSSQPMQSSQPMTSGGFSGGGLSGFGRPAQIGAGQQALGSVLGAFGQSRQLGLTAQGAGVAPSGSFGGGGGFAAAAAAGGGFAAAATPGGGFAAAATTGGGFAAVAPSGGGFAGAASASGGFGAPPGSGFASGGFGSFAPKQGAGGGFSSFGGASAAGGGGGFSSFGGASAAGGEKPPASLLMQMRK